MLGLDGVAIASCVDRIDRVIPQNENPYYVLAQRGCFLCRIDLLHALGIAHAPDAVSITCRKDGELCSTLLRAQPAGARTVWRHVAPQMLWVDDDADLSWRMIRRDVMYINFRGYGRLEALAQRLAQVLDQARPRALIVDLRHNGGGNYDKGRRHLLYLLQSRADLNRRGRLFVLIGRRTFSAAMVNAADLVRETEAVLVGEPTGARPNGYQELSTFVLPHSQLVVACAVNHYRFAVDRPDAIYPDIAVEPTWEQYSAGRDSAIERALVEIG